MASTVMITVCRQAEADSLLAQGVIIAGKTRPVDRHYDIAPDTQYPICAK